MNLLWQLYKLVWTSAGGRPVGLDNLSFVQALLLSKLVFLNVHAPISAIVFSVGVLEPNISPDRLGVGAIQVVGLGFSVHKSIHAPLFGIDPFNLLDAAFIELLHCRLILAVAGLLLV